MGRCANTIAFEWAQQLKNKIFWNLELRSCGKSLKSVFFVCIWFVSTFWLSFHSRIVINFNQSHFRLRIFVLRICESKMANATEAFKWWHGDFCIYGWPFATKKFQSFSSDLQCLVRKRTHRSVDIDWENCGSTNCKYKQKKHELREKISYLNGLSRSVI